MPRCTRNGHKATIHEDDHSDNDTTTTSSETPTGAPRAIRRPLVELSNTTNSPQREANIILEINLTKLIAKPRQQESTLAKGNKENAEGVLEDSCPSTPSPAAEEARYQLRKARGPPAVISPARNVGSTPSSRAANMACKRLHREQCTPEGDTTMFKGAHELNARENFRSPMQKATLGQAPGLERIEDSVEAQDALEEVIAELDCLMSPKGVTVIKEVSANALDLAKTSAPDKLQATDQMESPACTTLQTLNMAKKTPAGRDRSKADSNIAAGKSDEHPRPNQNVTFTTPMRKAQEVCYMVADRTNHMPVSLRKAPFVPIRSSKPTTKSTFTLPGEAVAARLKAQRQERELRRKSGLSAATVRGTSFTGPNSRARPATTTNPKQSAVNGSVTAPKQLVTASGVFKPATIGGKIANCGKPHRTSSACTTSTQINGTTRANTKAPISRPPKALMEIFNPPSSEIRADHSKSAPSSKDSETRSTTQHPRDNVGRIGAASATLSSAISRPRQPPAARKSEVAAKMSMATSSRPKPATLGVTSGNQMRTMVRAQNTQERKAREEVSKEAARQARVEAAEKGRLASREWAARQRVKAKMAAKKSEAVRREDLVPEVREVEVDVNVDLDVDIEVGLERVVV